MTCQGRLFALLLVIATLPACGSAKKTGDGTRRWNSFPIPLYADASIASDSQSMADFRDAMNFWEAKTGRRLFDFRGAWQSQTLPFEGNPNSPSIIFANVLFLLNPWPYAGNIAGQTVVNSSDDQIDGSIIMINPNTPICAGDCAGDMFRTSERKVFTHELGHFLGLPHTQDVNNIMYPEIRPGGSLTGLAIDVASLQKLTN